MRCHVCSTCGMDLRRLRALRDPQHTVRGFIAGVIKKKLGLDVTSEKVEGRGRVNRRTG